MLCEIWRIEHTLNQPVLLEKLFWSIKKLYYTCLYVYILTAKCYLG